MRLVDAAAAPPGDGSRVVTDRTTVPAQVEEIVTPMPATRSRPAVAAGTAHDDVEAVNRRADRQLYAVRRKVYPRLAGGRYRAVKWGVMLVTLAIYYGLPWLRWSRGPDLPDQAVLLDVANNRFFVFFLEIWPQEFYFVTGLLIIAALTLFLVTSVAGRVWCGYACPQTVWTDLMITIERFWQGDRNARIRLDREPWSVGKLFRKAMTHLSWMAVGLATGGALVFYFRDAPTLAREFVTGSAPAVAYLFLAIFTFTTYLLGGIAREQVCTYMCPWPRIQGAMTDRHTLLVGYKPERGEPRGAARKGPDGEVDWSTRGDCIDCKACVAVCPAGIDIRDGSQLECIQCALCIDACDDIMTRISRPRGLIDYTTPAQQSAVASAGHVPVQVVRARTLLYAGLLCLVGLVLLAAWSRRSVLEVNVIHERTPPYVRLSDGSVRNRYTVKLLNKLHTPRIFSIAVSGVANARLAVIGIEDAARDGVAVPTDDLREIKVLVTAPADDVRMLAGATVPLTITVTDRETGRAAQRLTSFQHEARVSGR